MTEEQALALAAELQELGVSLLKKAARIRTAVRSGAYEKPDPPAYKSRRWSRTEKRWLP
jgi:hypothetical protein